MYIYGFKYGSGGESRNAQAGVGILEPHVHHNLITPQRLCCFISISY